MGNQYQLECCLPPPTNKIYLKKITLSFRSLKHLTKETNFWPSLVQKQQLLRRILIMPPRIRYKLLLFSVFPSIFRFRVSWNNIFGSLVTCFMTLTASCYLTNVKLFSLPWVWCMLVMVITSWSNNNYFGVLHLALPGLCLFTISNDFPLWVGFSWY